MGWNYVAKSSTLWLSVPVLVIVLFIAATALRAYRRYLRSEREKAKGCHDAIFVLGGHRSREHYAARIACIGGNRHLPIFVSSGSYWKIRDFDPLNLSNPFRESFTGVDFKSLRYQWSFFYCHQISQIYYSWPSFHHRLHHPSSLLSFIQKTIMDVIGL